MKITRTIQCKELIKLSNAVNSVQAHLDNINNLLDSPRLPSYPVEGTIKDILKRMVGDASTLEYFCNASKDTHANNKPTRFTPEQLKEMVYLRDAGLTVGKLAARYGSNPITINKYLAEEKAKAGESND